MTAPSPIRILIVDDHAMFRQGLKLLLQRDAGLQVVGEAADAEEALTLAAREEPHVILLDVDLEGFDALDIIESLQASAPGTRIIVLTGMRTAELQARALRLGAKGFVPKDQSGELVVRAIRRVREGELWFDRVTVSAAVTTLLRREGTEQAPVAHLTPRELEIVRMVGEGLRNEAIAERLSIQEKTVRNHLTVIFEKADVRDRLHLAIYAYRRGLAKLPL